MTPPLDIVGDAPVVRVDDLSAGYQVEGQFIRAVDSVKGIVAAAPSALARDLYVDKVAAKIGASADAVRRAEDETGLPAADVVTQGADRLLEAVLAGKK